MRIWDVDQPNILVPLISGMSPKSRSAKRKSDQMVDVIDDYYSDDDYEVRIGQS